MNTQSPHFQKQEQKNVAEAMTDHKQQLLDTILGRWRSQVLYAGVSLGIFDLLSDKTISADQVAEVLALNPQMAYRLMRAIASIGALTETPDHEFMLNESGKYLKSDHPESMRGMVLLEEGPEHYAAWSHLPDIVRDGYTDGFHREYGKPVTLHAAEDDGYGTIFNEAMSGYATSDAEMFLDAIKNESFSGINHICDIGGGHGHLICHVLKRYPHLEGTVFDTITAFEDRDRIWSERADVQDRCTFLPGNMFEHAPEADGYIMKHILHAWNDDECVQILEKIADAAHNHSKLFLAEFIVPDTATPHYAKLYDVHMMCATNGQERTESEYRNLLSQSGWRHISTMPSFGPLNVIQAAKV